MRWHYGFIAAIASVSLVIGCASSPAANPSAKEAGNAGTSDQPELSEPRLTALDLSVILPLLSEPAQATSTAPSSEKAPESAVASSPLESALPPIEPSPHRASPKQAVFDSSAIKLASPALASSLAAAAPAPAAPAVQPTSKPARPAPAAKSPSPAVKKPKASAPSAETSKKKAEAAAQVPSFASTPSSETPVADPAASREPDIAQRVVVELGSRIEIPLDGTGWTYLGEKDGKDGVLYESRRYEGSGLVFVLNPTKTGEYTLRFQRQDALRGKTNDELVGVTVTPRAAKAASAPQTVDANGSAVPAQVAPALASASPSAAAATASSPVAASSPIGATGLPSASSAIPSQASASPPASSTAGSALPAAVAPDSPEGLVLTAKNELAAGRVPSAIAALDRFLSLYPAGMDEVYYLYGFALEQNGPYRDIQKAYNYYKKVSDDYPESPLWDKAQERASYIERHYFEIR